jgi:hypothetical protein
MVQDIRFGLRLVLRSPWLSITAIVSLAIGIGATTAVFTVINAALLKALPYPDIDRLVAVTRPDIGYFTLSEFRALDAGTDRRTAPLEHLAAVETRDFVLSEAGRRTSSGTASSKYSVASPPLRLRHAPRPHCPLASCRLPMQRQSHRPFVSHPSGRCWSNMSGRCC